MKTPICSLAFTSCSDTVIILFTREKHASSLFFFFFFKAAAIILITHLNTGLIERGWKEAMGHKRIGKSDLRTWMCNAPRADLYKRNFSTMLSQHTVIKRGKMR